MATVYAALAYGALVAAEPLPPAAAGQQAPAGGDVQAWLPFRPTPQRLAVLRTEAVILGGVRAGAVTAYAMTPADLHGAEASAGAVVILDPAVAPWRFATGHSERAANLTSEEAASLEFGPMSVQELALFLAMAKMGMAIAPLVGVSLLDTGHHYLSAGKRPFDAVERQVVGGLAQDARALWAADAQRSRDLANHKALHPAANALLTGLARDPALPARLTTAGLGSAAVRLPYIEGEIRAARAIVAVVEAVQVFCGQSGYAIAVPHLQACLRYVASYPPNAGQPAEGPPAGIVAAPNRLRAIADILTPAMVAARPLAAVASGMYAQILENAGSNRAMDTRLQAYSIKKAQQECTGSVAMGAAAVRDYNAYRRAKTDKGELTPWALTDAVPMPAPQAAQAPNAPPAANAAQAP